MKINYEIKGDKSITLCPYKNNCHVGSFGCVVLCCNFIDIERNKYVDCKGEKPK